MLIVARRRGPAPKNVFASFILGKKTFKQFRRTISRLENKNRVATIVGYDRMRFNLCNKRLSDRIHISNLRQICISTRQTNRVLRNICTRKV